MAFRIDFEPGLDHEIRRIALEQLDKGLSELDAADHDLHEAIHQVRKRAKKLRALLRLVRDEVSDTYDRENATLRDTAKVSDRSSGCTRSAQPQSIISSYVRPK